MRVSKIYIRNHFIIRILIHYSLIRPGWRSPRLSSLPLGRRPEFRGLSRARWVTLGRVVQLLGIIGCTASSSAVGSLISPRRVSGPVLVVLPAFFHEEVRRRLLVKLVT